MMLIILLTILFSSALLFFIRKRSVIEPAKFFSIYWIAQLILIPVFFFNIYEFHWMSMAYILSCCVIILFTSSVGKSVAVSTPENGYNVEFIERRSYVIFIVITALSFIYPIVRIRNYGFGLDSFFNLNQLLEMNQAIAVDRYKGGAEDSTILEQILLVFVYLSPVYAGFISINYPKKKQWQFFLAFLPTLIIAISQAMKANLIGSVFLWISGRIVGLYAADRFAITLNLKKIFRIALILFVFFGLLFFSLLMRTDNIDIENIQLISYRFLNYALGHLPAFDIWFTQNWNTPYPFELKTFYGISNYLGLASREQGVFTEFLSYGSGNSSDEFVSNVFTFFRFIIEDFGVIGSLIFVGIMGFLSGFSFVNIVKKSNSFLSKTFMTSFIFFVLFSFATSVWAYTSYVVTFILFYVIIRLSYKKTQTL